MTTDCTKRGRLLRELERRELERLESEYERTLRDMDMILGMTTEPVVFVARTDARRDT